ncbi:MAG: hypothetical protein MPL62_12310 [Alphaproteobacteria bacterium]|nr:hypothetical protein [Alphaproteobacteria bacterium]
MTQRVGLQGHLTEPYWWQTKRRIAEATIESPAVNQPWVFDKPSMLKLPVTAIAKHCWERKAGTELKMVSYQIVFLPI